MSWRLATRCSKCGFGIEYSSDIQPGPRGTIPPEDRDRVFCARCGGTLFDLPRPGRIAAIIWWNPGTWFSTRWEWNDDPEEVVPWPEPDGGKLYPIDGGKK